MINNITRNIISSPKKTIKNLTIAGALLLGGAIGSKINKTNNSPYIEMNPKDVPTDIYIGLDAFSRKEPDVSNNTKYKKIGEDTLRVDWYTINGEYSTDILFSYLELNAKNENKIIKTGYKKKQAFVYNGIALVPITRKVPVYEPKYIDIKTVFKTDRFFTKTDEYFKKGIYLPVEYYGLPKATP